MIVVEAGERPQEDAGVSRAIGAFIAKRHRNTKARPSRFDGAALASILAASVLLSCTVSNAWALGLGPASLHSTLGEPLRISLPVTREAGEDVGCVQVRPQGDELPSVFGTRASVVAVRGRTEIEISSAQPVDEPAIGVVVSVGCASPVARGYVFFLDPPPVPALAASAAPAARATIPARSAVRSTPPRRASSSSRRRAAPNASANASVPRAAQRAAIGAQASPQQRTRTSRRARKQASPVATRDALPRARAETSAAEAPKTAADRLTVAPTEPGTSATRESAPAAAAATPASPTPSPASTAPSNPSAASSAAPSSATSPSATPSLPTPSSATASPASPSSTAAAPSSTPPTAESMVAAADGVVPAMSREEQLRREQAELQKRVQALTDQINVLRVQTTTLSTRNQALESAAFSPLLVWLLIALAVFAIAIAGWMAMRHAQLRRSLEGSSWWGNTVQAPTSGAPTTTGAASDAATLGANTRLAPSPADLRAPAAAASSAAVSTSNAQDRSRPAARGARYASAIDSDFTASDIEAALATVRTVSPTRSPPRPGVLGETDFAALGGPTIPSPFADPPAAQPSGSTGAADDRTREDAAKSADGGPGSVVDFDIPPLTASSEARQARALGELHEDDTSAEKTVPLDLKLDLPGHGDALSTDSMKTTIVSPREPSTASDVELASVPTALDFELPSVTEVTPLQALDDDADELPLRHGATALADLFPSLGGPGADTILNLDEEEGAPLTPTEVDRLVATEVEASQKEVQHASTQFRMMRFSDLVHQIDETASTDPLRAIAMLRQYVLRDEQIPTLLWLRLFELYKRVDKKAVYEALGEHFTRRYRRAMVGWNESLVDRVPQLSLTAMPEIDRELVAKWGSEEGLERLRSLLCDRNQPDAIVFNAALQRDLLDAAKVFPLDHNTLSDYGSRMPRRSDSTK